MLRKFRLDVFALIWLPYAYLVGRFWFVADDAFISFRFARNLVLGNGLRYNPGEDPPVEGYSNFLWVLVTALVQWLGLDVTFWIPLLSSACGSVLLFLVFDLLQRRMGVGLVNAVLATLALGFFPPFAVWSSSGLETMPFALLTFLTFERLVLRERGVDALGGAICALLLGAIRAEGFAWVAVIVLLALVSRRMSGQRSSRPFALHLLWVATGFVAYLVWRYSYHGDLVSNTAHAKLGLPASYLIRGFDYVAVQFLTFLTPFVLFVAPFFALCRARVAVGLPVLLMAWAYPLYSIAVKGDFMAMGRFLIPGFAFQSVLLGWMLHDVAARSDLHRRLAAVLGALVVVIGALPGFDLHLVPRSARAAFHFRMNSGDGPDGYSSEFEQWSFQRRNSELWAARGKALKAYAAAHALTDAPSVVIGAIGATGYYADMTVYDLNGLVTPEVARRPFAPERGVKSPGHDKSVSWTFFLPLAPTFLKADVIATDDRAALAAGLERFAQPLLATSELESRYVPDFARLVESDRDGTPQYLIVWRRLLPEADREEAVGRFRASLDALESGGIVPELSWVARDVQGLERSGE